VENACYAFVYILFAQHRQVYNDVHVA